MGEEGGTGAHKRRFTVTLTSCTASGQMLQPFVTFKAKTEHILKKIKVKENDVITTQANRWMDYKLMMRWIRKVLVKYTKGRHALLVFDTFKEHLKEGVLAKLIENNISYVAA